MEAALGIAGDASAFAELLLRLAGEKRPDGSTRLSAFLERLGDFTEERIPDAHIPSIVHALLNVGDGLLLPEDERKHIFDIGDNGLRIGWAIWPLLKRLPENERFEVLKSASAQSDSVSLIVDKVSYLARQHGKLTDRPAKPEEERLVNAEHLGELEQLALAKIRAARDQNRLIDTPELPHVLWRWRDWAGEAEVSTWAKGAIASDGGLVKFLSRYLQKSFSQGMSDVVGQVHYRLDPKWLEPFVSPAEIISRARSLVVNADLNDLQRKALACFIEGYEKRQAGKDPNDPFDR
jgi:predicted KAP-like P-loop ATPase